MSFFVLFTLGLIAGGTGGALIYVLKELLAKEVLSGIRRREAARLLTVVMMPLALGIAVGWIIEEIAESAAGGTTTSVETG